MSQENQKLLIVEDDSAPVVAHHSWYEVGSRHEQEGKTGLAHFFEHLMFNETRGLAYGEFDRRMEEAGAETNAATWCDWTYTLPYFNKPELPFDSAISRANMTGDSIAAQLCAAHAGRGSSA